MTLTEDDKKVQDFLFGASDPRFGKGIQIRSPRRNGTEFDPIVLQDGTEIGRELAVPIADDMRGFGVALFGEEHRQVAGLLSYPDAVRVGCTRYNR